MIAKKTTDKPRRRKQPILTRQRKQLILSFIHEYRRVRQISPTLEEITTGIGYKPSSFGTVSVYTQALIAEGWLKQPQTGARTLVPVYPPDKMYADIVDPSLKLIERQQHNLRILRRL